MPTCNHREGFSHCSECCAEEVERELSSLFRTPEGATRITVNILREWDRDKIRAFALHLLGDDWQALDARLFEAQGVIRELRGDIARLKGRLGIGVQGQE